MKYFFAVFLCIFVCFFTYGGYKRTKLHDLPAELYFYVIYYKNMYRLNRVNNYFYHFIQNTPRYKKRIEKKAEFLCKKNIHQNIFLLNYNTFPDFWFQYNEHGVVHENTKETIRKSYNEMFPLLFLKHVRCIQGGNRRKDMCWRLDTFCRKYPQLLKGQPICYSIPESNHLMGSYLYTLCDKKTGENKKLIMIMDRLDTPAHHSKCEILLQFFEKLRWQEDNAVVRIIFPYITFESYPCVFLSFLRDNFLQRPIIVQDKFGKTFFHEACDKENIKNIKRYNPGYFDVVDCNGNVGRTWAQMRITPWNVNEEILQIIKYLVTGQVKQGDLLTKNQQNKLPTKELRVWYKTLQDNL